MAVRIERMVTDVVPAPARAPVDGGGAASAADSHVARDRARLEAEAARERARRLDARSDDE